jgi:hypothetical protein
MVMLLDQITQYIQEAARKRGIDPNVALKVAQSEGLGQDWQSNVVKNGVREPSYGDFQLYTGGGMGNDFEKATGLKASDPNNRLPMIDYALDQAREKGWTPWYGAKRVGITGKMGIGAVPHTQPASGIPSPTPERQRFDTLVASKLGTPTDMASDAYASGQLRPDNTGPGFDSSIAQDFTQGRGTGVQNTGQPTNILPQPADTTEAAMAAEEAEASGGSGGNWLSRLIPGDESTKNMGILERMRQPGNREMFLRLGAGIAGGANKGWGTGLGLGFEGAADALEKQRALDIKQREFDIENMPKALSVQFLAEKYMNENKLSQSDAMKKAFIDVYATDIRKQGERGLTPFYTREKQKDGTYKIRAWQPTKDGNPEEMNVGENQEFDPGIEFRGLGTKDVGFDRFGNPVVSSNIDNAGKARDTQAGQAWGQAQVDLPKVVSSADALRGYINKVRNDPNLSRMTGALQGRFMNVTGTAGDVQARIDQLKGKGFLQAFQELKGAGAITEKEGEKAEQAFARLANMAVTDEAYVTALDDFNDEIERLVQLAQLKAQGPAAWQGGGTTAPPPAPAPTPDPAAAPDSGITIKRIN